MTGYTGQVNLYNGEIELQSNTLGNSNVNTNKFFSGDITLSSGTLNIQNSSIDNIIVSNLTSTANANLKFDADLSNNTSDNFTVLDTASGELNLTAINILGVNRDNGQLTLFNDGVAPTLNILTTANYGGYEYTFTNSSDTLGVLNYEQTGTTRTFKEVVNDVVPGYRSYSLAGDEVVTEDLGKLGGTQLTIFGNGKDIEGNNLKGVVISKGKQHLVINDAGFNNFESAIANNKKSSSVTVNSSMFNNNNALKGSAIYNLGYLEINNSTFSSNYSFYGGALINGDGQYSEGKSAKAYLNNVLFENNSAQTGGAILNDVSCNMTINDVSFSTNTATGRDGIFGGGAIANKGTMAITGNSLFGNNESRISGGAIENSGNLNINGVAEFIGNKATQNGGAISNNSAQIQLSGEKIEFNSNTAGDSGGAICNGDNSTVTIKGRDIFFSSNVAVDAGGAVCNTNNSSMAISSDIMLFSFNNTEFGGGAIYNSFDSTMTISGIDGAAGIIFNSNTTAGSGGAICNESKMDIDSDVIEFNSNKAGSGGAIYNKGILTINGGIFTIFHSNTAFDPQETAGGAIYNEGTLNLISTGRLEFTGNTANGVSNAINNNGTINLYAIENSAIIFNDRITSLNSNSILNINQSRPKALKAIGKIVLNENMQGYTGQVNLYAGTVQIGQYGTWFAGNTYVDNATIDMANSVLQEHNFNTLRVKNNLNLFVDADLAKKQMDTITAKEDSDIQGKINIKAINILQDATENKTEILFTSSTVLQDKITTRKTASSNLYKYDVNYNNSTGEISFNKRGINPVLAQSQVANEVGGTITQTAILNKAFTSIDTQIADIRLATKQNKQLYASTVNQLFSTSKLERSLWIRPYMINETVKLTDYDVDNNVYGTLAGLDLSIGENSLLSFYIGYAGSTQKYEDIKINQTGYVLGATGMIIKDDYYLGLTANINFNKAESENDYGTDNFDMNMYSVGAKAGYNIELGKNWILEPNLTLMYGTINTPEYKTKQGTGAKINSQSTNNVLIEPQVKAKLDLTGGWAPYALVGYVFNSGNKTKLVANNIAFDDMQISGYAEYGLGVNKSFKDSFWSCSLQVIGKCGDKNGFEGNVGVRYSF